MIVEIDAYEQTLLFGSCMLMQDHAKQAVLCVLSHNLEYLIIQYLVQSHGRWITGILVHCLCLALNIACAHVYTV